MDGEEEDKPGKFDFLANLAQDELEALWESNWVFLGINEVNLEKNSTMDCSPSNPLPAQGMAATQDTRRSTDSDARAGEEHLRRWIRRSVDVSALSKDPSLRALKQ